MIEYKLHLQIVIHVERYMIEYKLHLQIFIHVPQQIEIAKGVGDWQALVKSLSKENAIKSAHWSSLDTGIDQMDNWTVTNVSRNGGIGM